MAELKDEVISEDSLDVEKEVVKPTRQRKKKQESKVSFQFSDADVKEKEIRSNIVANSPIDDKIFKAWKEESRLVKGIFRCREPAGGSVKFAFRKYKWDQTKWYTMFDGKEYEIPLAVARHLNQNCNYAVHSHILGPDGNPTVDVTGKKTSRMNFEGLEFAG